MGEKSAQKRQYIIEDAELKNIFDNDLNISVFNKRI